MVKGGEEGEEGEEGEADAYHSLQTQGGLLLSGSTAVLLDVVCLRIAEENYQLPRR